MATVVNIGVHEGVLKDRGLALEKAGHRVRNALTLRQLEQALCAGECDAVLVGHSLTPSEKRRAQSCAKQWNAGCPMIEIYVHLPELPDAAVHVRIDDGIPALLEAVNGACASHSH